MASIKRLVLMALFSATAFVLQIALASFPNIELVTLWFLVIAQMITLKESFIVIFIFTLLEALVWGFGDWVIGYLWIWLLWMVMIQMLKPTLKKNEFAWAFLGLLYGLIFGGLFAIQYALMYGVQMGMLYWLRGLLFDLIHGASNFILILILYKPLIKSTQKLLNRWRYLG